MEIKMGGKSVWRKWQQAMLLLAESDTREIARTKANPRIQSHRRD